MLRHEQGVSAGGVRSGRPLAGGPRAPATKRNAGYAPAEDEEAPSDPKPPSAAEVLEAWALDRIPSSARVDPWQQEQAGFTSGGGGK